MNILLTESQGFSPRALEILAALGHVQQLDLSAPELRNAVADCEVLWIRLRNFIGAEVLGSAPRLQWIVTPTTGLNHIDLELADQRGIRILSLKGEVDFLKEIRATAEYTIGLMIALLRQIPAAIVSVNQGVWNRDQFRGRELYEQRVGLIGFGRLGRIVAGYLRAFGSSVMAFDPAASSINMEGVKFVSLDELLRSVKLVSLHASYEPANECFFNASCFDLMPKGSWLVNTARGELVDERALLQALETGRLAGAALDVFDQEPIQKDNPMLGMENVIFSPHNAGISPKSKKKSYNMSFEEIIRIATGQAPTCRVN